MKDRLNKLKNAAYTWKKTATKIGISKNEPSMMVAAFRI
jgi:hypothetical protein